MEKVIEDINAILDGKMKADKAHKDAQKWLMITCYLLADDVARKPTKKARRRALEIVKENEPLFYDDVEKLAKKLYQDRNK